MINIFFLYISNRNNILTIDVIKTIKEYNYAS